MAEGGTTSGVCKERNIHSLDIKENDSLTAKEAVGEGPSIPECAVCLQTCVHPAQLPCGHIFCFLCVKGVANQSKKCAMCRQEIPSDYLEKPQLVDTSYFEKENSGFDDGYQWFYEGRNGWWQYDERTSRELENAYKRGERICELLIAGFLYVADFDAMLQLRRNDPSRRRRIKRDLATIPKKGVAGLRLDGSQPYEENQRCKSPILETDVSSGTSTPVPPTNTPQTPAGSMASGGATPERHGSLDQALEQIRSLSLRDYTTPSDSSEDDHGSGDENQDLPDFSGLITSPWVLTFSSDEDQL